MNTKFHLGLLLPWLENYFFMSAKNQKTRSPFFRKTSPFKKKNRGSFFEINGQASRTVAHECYKALFN
eukprot:NODE_3264_length_411_cov_93.773481_g2736_i0.p1 GENE.NODE_3264_length_411_cov_93.773481_g2736_i0~~NODE_3264_length_411_cov_93.773481_g2736_i0.p1  ORF type:complete len:68 (+),score=8.64 NODE_3264_length_411_cov_93.773481_g2736_i0:140-343(+)